MYICLLNGLRVVWRMSQDSIGGAGKIGEATATRRGQQAVVGDDGWVRGWVARVQCAEDVQAGTSSDAESRGRATRRIGGVKHRIEGGEGERERGRERKGKEEASKQAERGREKRARKAHAPCARFSSRVGIKSGQVRSGQLQQWELGWLLGDVGMEPKAVYHTSAVIPMRMDGAGAVEKKMRSGSGGAWVETGGTSEWAFARAMRVQKSKKASTSRPSSDAIEWMGRMGYCGER